MLKELRFAVFGLGNSLYADNYNVIAKNVDQFLSQLSAERIIPLELGDENVAESKHGSIEQDFQAWKTVIVNKISGKDGGNTKNGAKSESVDATETSSSTGESGFSSSEEEEEEEEGDGLVDLEDLGAVLGKAKTKVAKSTEVKEMVTPQLRQSL